MSIGAAIIIVLIVLLLGRAIGIVGLGLVLAALTMIFMVCKL